MNAKKKVLDAAYELFCERGYEKTSVQSIIDKAGTSKGGFYHHFGTKEDVVEAITFQFVDELKSRYHKMQEDETKSVFELINGVIREVNSYKVSMIGTWPGLTKMFSFEGNTRVIQSMAKQFEKVTADAYYSLIIRGVNERLFNTEYPKQSAKLFAREMISLYSMLTRVLMSDDEEVYNEFVCDLEFIECVLNNSLGLSNNEISIKYEALKYLQEVNKTKGEINK